MRDLAFWGVLVSLLYTELTGLSPGGIIVPAYLTLYLHDPWRIALTLGMALACVGIVRLLSRYMILYGRRRFAVYIMVGMLLKVLLGTVYRDIPLDLPNLSLSIGYVIPGLIGRDMERQGVVKTLLSLGVVCCLLRLAQMVLVR